MMLKYKVNWVDVPNIDSPEGPGYKHFQVLLSAADIDHAMPC